MTPWRGPTTEMDNNALALMLSLLWPDIASPLADPAFLAAAGTN